MAPYNAQVAVLTGRLPAGARIGTVDRFQGQEASVVFYSMTTSTPDDAPRGMEFLYSTYRLNVAISRARCVAVMVASPDLFNVQCKTPRQIELANAFCRFLEMASVPRKQIMNLQSPSHIEIAASGPAVQMSVADWHYWLQTQEAPAGYAWLEPPAPLLECANSGST